MTAPPPEVEVVVRGVAPEDADLDKAAALRRFRAVAAATKHVIMLRLVYVRYIADVDTADQTFSACFGLDMLWKATDDDKRRFEADPAGFTPSWVPNFEFPSAKNVTLERRALVTGCPFKVTPDGYNFLRTLVTGTFMERFELDSFPFDVQDLTVKMDMSFDLKDQAVLVPWNESWALDGATPPSSSKNFLQWNRAFSSIPDFSMRRVLCEFAIREDCWAQVTIRFQMARIPQGVLGRIGSLCLLLGLSSLSVFTIPPDDVASRVNFSMTNILAFAAFAVVVSSSLPPTPRLTLLDKYTLASVVFLVAVMSVIAVMARSPWDTPAEYVAADNALFFASVGMYALLQLFFAVQATRMRRNELKKLDMSFAQLDEVNRGDEDSPINIYGTGFDVRAAHATKGDPAIVFEGEDNRGGNFFG